MVVVWSEERVREKEGDDERKREKVAAENPSIPLMSVEITKLSLMLYLCLKKCV